MTEAEKIVSLIDGIRSERGVQAPRAYIGASVVGKPCDAFLAYSLRGFPEDQIEPRVLRIFRLGNVLEDEVVSDLKAAYKGTGLAVWPVDPMTGKQFTWLMYGGHVKAHADGQIEGTDGRLRGLEIKSMGLKPFEECKSVGVARSHPMYAAQMQMMMGLSGLTSFLFVAYCKNTSEYHAEVVDADEFEWAHIKSRIDTVMRGEAKKIGRDASDWRCRFCSRSSVCWAEADVPKSCATCVMAAPRDDGRWHCFLNDAEAKTVCDSWSVYRPMDAGGKP
jgi:hypothetical protein